MNITEKLRLDANVLIISADQLDSEVRLRCKCESDEYVVSKPRSRSLSRVVSKDVATLLEQFRHPSTIVDAVIRLSKEENTEPSSLLPNVLDALLPFIQARWLTSESDEFPLLHVPSLMSGDIFEGYRILDCCHFVEDTEVYQARDDRENFVALKISKKGVRRDVINQFKLEAHVLKQADGAPIPKLIEAGESGNKCYIVTSWCEGITAERAAHELQQLESDHANRALFDLCRNILEAYYRLHRNGILHGDVNSGNILVDGKNRISLIDFGLARIIDDPKYRVRRKGVAEFYEPEFADAIAKKLPHPDPSEKGEQYIVAALLYRIITGQHYLKLSGVADEMLNQITLDMPRTFVELGRTAWPDVEGVLSIALQKNPATRYASMEKFFEAFSSVKPLEYYANDKLATYRDSENVFREIAKELSTREIDSDFLSSDLPRVSVTHGSAGVAIALQHLAKHKQDPQILSLSDVWACKAARDIDSPAAFFSNKLGLNQDRIGLNSVYYGKPGVFVAQAFVANAMADKASFINAVSALSGLCSDVNGEDLTLGRAGIVVACALLLDGIENTAFTDNPLHDPILTLNRLGRENCERLINTIGVGLKDGDYLGVAHGLAGMTYAALLWSDVSGDSVPIEIVSALERLKSLSHAHGRGLSWPTRYGSVIKFMESWCHGAPGYIHLWTISSRVLREPSYLSLAEQAAWTVWEDKDEGGTLCCGLTGRAYGLLNLYRHTGTREWLKRAESLAVRAVNSCQSFVDNRYSLFQGTLGAAILAASMNDPERSTFPLFERQVRM